MKTEENGNVRKIEETFLLFNTCRLDELFAWLEFDRKKICYERFCFYFAKSKIFDDFLKRFSFV